MMGKYRKKPVVIEAIQLTWPNWSDICEFVDEKHFGGGCYLDKIGNPTIGTSTGMMGLRIKTLEGEMLARQGDWIIKGVNGEFYPCKPDIFEKTYEAVE